ncbi:tryptophan synthase subunit alpha [Blattabacterium cuenoti]|uniref:tryptophan synthase subunit alpha n=1 Tax=Blattabacterium cuenoti TaxID=1653831 RepID=UPI00163C5B91|nr:tryptophan synthase subunit alpha [Blattabacterium cuenoti]
MNKIDLLFQKKNKNVLCIYFTAGYPNVNSTFKILKTLQSYKVDLIEIGIPYSDPICDGKIIQNSNKIALKNGMNLTLLLNQIKELKKKIHTPIILMGYFNQIYKFGVNVFLKECNKIGISGLIFPDLPVDLFIKEYKNLFYKYSLHLIFLITPQTSNSRILFLSKITGGFLYLVSSNSITGKICSFGKDQLSFFERIKKLSITVPKLIGFGINNRVTFNLACKYANGGIIGSSFINSLDLDEKKLDKSISKYIINIQNK